VSCTVIEDSVFSFQTLQVNATGMPKCLLLSCWVLKIASFFKGKKGKRIGPFVFGWECEREIVLKLEVECRK